MTDHPNPCYCKKCEIVDALEIVSHRRVLVNPDAEMIATEELRHRWAQRLADAVNGNIITEAEAREAIRQIDAR